MQLNLFLMILSVAKYLESKGFIPENHQWMELNATKDQITIEIIAKGQEIIIVIGESLNKEKIEEYIKNQHSW